MEKYELNFIAEAENHGHILKRDEDGDIDMFAMSADYHNGPRCILCFDSWCVHCKSAIEPCDHSEVAIKAVKYNYENIMLAMTLDLENNFKDQAIDKMIEENK